MTYFSSGDVSDGQFPIGVLRRLSDASPTGALREGVALLILYGFESDKKLDDAGYENAKSVPCCNQQEIDNNSETDQ